MNEREELKQELQEELKWVNYRMKILDLIEKKLMEMKEIAEKAKNNNLSSEERQYLNVKINNLAMQVRALDEESRKIESERILNKTQ